LERVDTDANVRPIVPLPMRAKNLEQGQVMLVWLVLPQVLVVPELLKHHQSGVPLAKNTSGVFVPLKKLMILSLATGVPEKRTTATIVRPPLVEMFKLRGPASRNCDFVLQAALFVPLVELLVTTLQFASKPVLTTEFESEVKTTWRYPVDDLKTLLVSPVPLNFATWTFERHNESEQLLIVTTSISTDVLNDVKESWIKSADAIIQMQLSPFR
jgi:hypothetical protein